MSLRGRTRPRRLRLFDALRLALGCPAGRWIDVGVGDTPDTTLELRAAPGGEGLIALELDPNRAARAQAAGLRVEVGGLERLVDLGPAAFIRAANVLRGQDVGDARRGQGLICAALAAGGLGLEGTTDREGAFASALELRAEHPRRRALLLAADLSAGFAPAALRHVLPRDLRGRAREGALGALFAAWDEGFAEARASSPRAAPAELWRRSIPEGCGARLLRLPEGVGLRWAPPGGVPD
jgi:hypothetical protein